MAGNHSTDPNQAVIDCVGSQPVMICCTIVDNLGTVLRLKQSELYVYNSILWQSSPEFLLTDILSELVIQYSNTADPWLDLGNLSADPLFAMPGHWNPDPEGVLVWSEGDYHLRSKNGRWNPILQSWEIDDQTSPCIGAGDTNILTEYGLPVYSEHLNCGVYAGTLNGSR